MALENSMINSIRYEMTFGESASRKKAKFEVNVSNTSLRKRQALRICEKHKSSVDEQMDVLLQALTNMYKMILKLFILKFKIK
jgi:hypothetical protein